MDESAFYLLPSVVATYAPRGQTPVLKAPVSYGHLSVISAITPSGHLYFELQNRAYRGEAVVAFLQLLHRRVRGKLLVIWDGATIHRCQAIKDYLAAGAARWLQLKRLPAYAPELNPDEGIWHYSFGSGVTQHGLTRSGRIRRTGAAGNPAGVAQPVRACVAKAHFNL